MQSGGWESRSGATCRVIEDGHFEMVGATTRAVVLLSGGMDSATCLALARRDGCECHALSFDYGQRHRAELDAANRIARTLGAIEHRTQRYNFADGVSVDVGYARETVTDNYKRNQFAVIAGMGMNYNLGKRVFHMDVRYRQGLTQLNQIRYASTSGLIGNQGQPGGKLYSSSLTFNFGMTLFNF